MMSGSFFVVWTIFASFWTIVSVGLGEKQYLCSRKSTNNKNEEDHPFWTYGLADGGLFVE